MLRKFLSLYGSATCFCWTFGQNDNDVLGKHWESCAHETRSVDETKTSISTFEMSYDLGAQAFY